MPTKKYGFVDYIAADTVKISGITVKASDPLQNGYNVKSEIKGKVQTTVGYNFRTGDLTISTRESPVKRWRFIPRIPSLFRS